MAERAHPDDPGFQHQGWRFRLRRGWMPWIFLPKKNPYLEALEWRYKWISPYAKGKRILDVPCGSGWGTSMIEGAAQLVGVDIDAGTIDFARARFGNVATFQVGSLDCLDFPDESFDIVTCLEGIEHVPIDVAEKFLHEAHRVLAAGGALFLSSPHCAAGGHSGNPYHIHEYQPDDIRNRIARHFQVEDVHTRYVDDLVVHYFRATKQL